MADHVGVGINLSFTWTGGNEVDLHSWIKRDGLTGLNKTATSKEFACSEKLPLKEERNDSARRT